MQTYFSDAQNYQTGLLTDVATDPFCGASTNVFGMDFAGDGTLYGIDNAGSLVTIDAATCAQSVVGPTPSQGGQTWSGLAWNAANGYNVCNFFSYWCILLCTQSTWLLVLQL